MKTKRTMIIIANLVWIGAARAETNNTAVSPDRITLYEVPLVCPAAPEIGCGSRSKPILLQLEREGSVAEAWVNRPGAIMAIVWEPETRRAERAATLRAVAEKEQFKPRELNGAARKEALKAFLSREGWHRGSDVDRLSEEEAGIIAARLVRRIETRVSLSAEQAKTLRAEFTGILKRRLTGEQDDNESNTEERLLTVLRSHLDEKDVAELEKTLPRSLRPLPGEQ